MHKNHTQQTILCDSHLKNDSEMIKKVLLLPSEGGCCHHLMRVAAAPIAIEEQPVVLQWEIGTKNHTNLFYLLKY